MKIDTHTHIWDSLNFSNNIKRYTPNYIFTQEDLEKITKAHGVEKMVLVQPSFLENDNSLILNTLKKNPQKYRGVIVLDNFDTFLNLKELLRQYDSLGVKGIRFNLMGKELPNFKEEKFQELFSIIISLDWHLEIHANENDICKLFEDYRDYDLKIVLDHFARPKGEHYSKEFLSILNSGMLFYIKLSGNYRFNNYFIYSYINSLFTALDEKRFLWGSDCPFTGFEDKLDYQTSIEFLTKNQLLYNLEDIFDNNAKELFNWK